MGAYDLETGDRIFMTDLAAVAPADRHFANDVTVGPDGTAYVTDFTPTRHLRRLGGRRSLGSPEGERVE